MNWLRVAIVVSTFLCVGCDHVTKHLAKRAYEHQPARPLIQNVLDLTYTENRDCGFGLLRAVPEEARKPLLTTIQLGAGIVCLALALQRKRTLWQRAAFLLISAGGLGNGIDRLLRGYVVDFIHLHYWPVFNVADIYLTVALVMMLVLGWRHRTPTAASAKA